MIASKHTEAALSPLLSPTLANTAGISHAFFTRQGGVSGGIYRSLNSGLGSADKKSSVLENRARMLSYFGGEAFLTVHQHHSTLCVRADKAWEPHDAPRADAIVTTTPGLVICAQAADCGPLLFADSQAGVIGAAHAGWKGALGGVLEATIKMMEDHGGDRSNIIAVLGPCISQKAYEVGPEFVDRFVQHQADYGSYFQASRRPGHAMFDLPGFILDRLIRTGVNAQTLSRCTYSEPDLFYSYRRSVHKNEPDYGRLASAIMLT